MKIFFSVLALLAASLLQKDFGDDSTPINNVQVIGSHNSYKQAMHPALYKMLFAANPKTANIDYEHIPLADQLNLGLRNLEIDIYADTLGGRYAHPKGLDMVPRQPVFDPQGEMKQPGFKVLHMIDLDYRSHCPTFKGCLIQLKNWSEAHPDHNPVFITLEGKDGAPRNPGDVAPEMFNERLFRDLDRDIITHLGRNHLILPDDVRGKYESLESAVLHGNWPTLKKARGKFIFILDDPGLKRDLYAAGHPSLKGRVLFVSAPPGRPEAAIRIINDPNNPEIPNLVKKGYIIRTRADENTLQARNNDYSNFKAACKSGAQIITTDYYQKSTHFPSNYEVAFDGASKYFRTNPLF